MFPAAGLCDEQRLTDHVVVHFVRLVHSDGQVRFIYCGKKPEDSEVNFKCVNSRIKCVISNMLTFFSELKIMSFFK